MSDIFLFSNKILRNARTCRVKREKERALLFYFSWKNQMYIMQPRMNLMQVANNTCFISTLSCNFNVLNLMYDIRRRERERVTC